ncbi:MAG: sigma-70 family RNA polymerase sigma factor [Deltaproteobacteria bacterium]|nr:sigma-70 family RNA polymerase sigma factor [Deltaproteobacteria bacterium]
MSERKGNDCVTAGNSNLTAAEDKDLPDEALMARIAGGETRAFAILVGRHRRRVLNMIYRSLGDRTQAEDVAQEVFLRVWRAAGGYSPKAKFTTWVYRIAVNLCLDAIKSARHRQSFIQPAGLPESATEGESSVGDNAPSPEELLIDAEKASRIFVALQELPANQRLAVVLKRFDGLAYEEISRILGCSVPAVESLLVRAKKTLREKLLSSG